MPQMSTEFAHALCALLWMSYCVEGNLIVRLWRPYSDPTVLLLSGVCFGHAQSVHRRSVFYAIPQRPLALPLCCYRDACECTAHTSAFCIFLGRLGIEVRMLLWCDRGFNKRPEVLWHFIKVCTICLDKTIIRDRKIYFF